MSWWELLITLIGGGGLVTLVTFFVNRHDKKKADTDESAKILRQLKDAFDAFSEAQTATNTKQSDMLIALGHDKIVWLGKQYIKCGEIASEDYASLKAVADAYQALGGNGEAKKIMDEVDRLPLKGE